MTSQKGFIYPPKYTLWRKIWYYLIGSYPMSRKTPKRAILSPRNWNNFYSNFFSISPKDRSFKLITFNTRLSTSTKSYAIGHKMGSFSLVDFRPILKKVTECVKNDEDIYLQNLLDLDSMQHNACFHFLRNGLYVILPLPENYVV